MSAAYVNGQWACYSLDGKKRHYLGCAHDRPRAAIAHTSSTYVSPRRSDEATTPVPVPPSGAGQMVASSESRKRDSGLLDRPAG